MAWTIAALTRAKRMPALADLIKPKKRTPKRRAMSGDQMLTIARMWSAVTAPKDDEEVV